MPGGNFFDILEMKENKIVSGYRILSAGLSKVWSVTQFSYLVFQGNADLVRILDAFSDYILFMDVPIPLLLFLSSI